MSKPTVFITGATGHVGGSTLEHIDKSKFNVKAGVRDLSKGQKLKGEGVEPVVIDKAKKDTLLNAFKGVDRLLIVPPNAQNRSQMGMNAIEAAIEAGVKLVVLFSVPGVEEKRIAFHKEWTPLEERLASSGLNYVITRAPFFQEMSLEFQDEVTLPFKDNGAVPSPSIYDLGRSIARVLEKPEPHHKKIYTLTGPEMLTGEDIAKALTEARGKPVRYRSITYEETVQMYMKKGTPKWQAEGVAELLLEYANRRVQLTKDVENITGKPPRTFRETAKLALAAQ